MKREHTEPIMINLPIPLIASMTKYINERRFESYSDMAKEAIQTWIDCEEDENFYEVMKNHEEWDGESPHPYGCGEEN